MRSRLYATIGLNAYSNVLRGPLDERDALMGRLFQPAV
jgi:hypothetical protein